MTGRGHSLRPRFSLGRLALLGLLAAACGTKAPAVTGLLATMTLPPGVDQIEVTVTRKDSGLRVAGPKTRPESAGAILASSQSVTIYLPDDLAGAIVICKVTALAAGVPTGASGEGEARLVRDRLVPVEISLLPGAPVDGAQPEAGTDAGVDTQVAPPDADKGGRDADKETPAGDAPRSNGQPCGNNDECESSLCVDGVCCASVCNGACIACNVRGKEGTCSPLESGAAPSPADACADQGAPSCGYNGACDGNGMCQRYEAGFTCKATACTPNGAGFVPMSACDGLGVCATAATVDCTPYVCDSTGGMPACRTTCRAGMADCVAPAVCVNGSCGLRPLKANGAGCVADGDCSSGHCADGVCCATTCTGPCVSCNLAAGPGTCRNVPAAKPDPHGVCKDGGAAACGQSGLCNGAGVCALYANGTTCAAGFCSGRMVRSAKRCNGLGACLAAPDQDCMTYRCNPATTECFTSCTSDLQCATAPRASCNGSGACER